MAAKLCANYATPVTLAAALLFLGCAGKEDDSAAPKRMPAMERPAKADRAEPADVRAVARGGNAFAFDLHRETAEAGNGFFSPISVSTALSMTYAGARGETAKEISKVLHYPFEGERLHLGYAGLIGRLSDAGKQAGVQLSVANALWGPFDYDKTFLAVNRDCYAATVRKIALVGAEPVINGWAEDCTAGRIKGLLPPGSLTRETILVLTNATYFKGEWERRFEKSATREELFRGRGGKTVRVPMMDQTSDFGYAHVGEGESAARVLRLPYKGGKLSMVVVLPDADDGLDAVERTLTAEKFEGWLGAMRKTKVRVGLPRFEIVGRTVDLKKPLTKLGMVEAFVAGKADFKGIGVVPNAHIDKVLHQAFVEVNERGSEAAAATAVVLDKDGWPSKDRPVRFVADHPFIFLIRDEITGGILFLGRLMDPK